MEVRLHLSVDSGHNLSKTDTNKIVSPKNPKILYLGFRVTLAITTSDTNTAICGGTQESSHLIGRLYTRIAVHKKYGVECWRVTMSLLGIAPPFQLLDLLVGADRKWAGGRKLKKLVCLGLFAVIRSRVGAPVVARG